MVAFALLLQLGSNDHGDLPFFLSAPPRLSKVYSFVEIYIACGLYSNAETRVVFIYRAGETFTTGYLHLCF